MKSKLKAVALCTVVAVAAIGLGAMDRIQHDRRATAYLIETCKSQPQLAECQAREKAGKNIRYTFNGQEFRDGNPVSAFGANE